jgi:hypothetical protein
MDTTLLKVPYVSQKAPGSNLHHNDCGPACMSMILKAFNLAMNVTVDELYNAINPTSDVALSASALRAKLEDIGLQTSWNEFVLPGKLYETLQESKPVIALIHYGTLVTKGYTQFTNFKEGHFVVLAGMDIANIFMLDPNRDDGVTVMAVPIDIFYQAWGKCHLDNGNPDFCGIVPDVAITDLSQGEQPGAGAGKYVLTVNGAYVHAEPSEDSPKVPPTIIWRVHQGNETVVTITEVENKYGHRLEGGWVSMDLLKPA